MPKPLPCREVINNADPADGIKPKKSPLKKIRKLFAKRKKKNKQKSSYEDIQEIW